MPSRDGRKASLFQVDMILAIIQKDKSCYEAVLLGYCTVQVTCMRLLKNVFIAALLSCW